MSTKNQHAIAAGEAPDSAPLFKAFEWVAPQCQAGPYQLLSNVRDLAAGVEVALQMVERSNTQKENGQAPLLDIQSEFYLNRMAIAAMSTITERIEAHFDWLTAKGDKV